MKKLSIKQKIQSIDKLAIKLFNSIPYKFVAIANQQNKDAIQAVINVVSLITTLPPQQLNAYQLGPLSDASTKLNNDVNNSYLEQLAKACDAIANTTPPYPSPLPPNSPPNKNLNSLVETAKTSASTLRSLKSQSLPPQSPPPTTKSTTKSKTNITNKQPTTPTQQQNQSNTEQTTENIPQQTPQQTKVSIALQKFLDVNPTGLLDQQTQDAIDNYLKINNVKEQMSPEQLEIAISTPGNPLYSEFFVKEP